MRTIDRPGSFKRDYKREAKGPRRRTLDAVLVPVLRALALDQALGTRYRDHDLNGNWVDHRECHLKPDLLLIYRKVGLELLILVRLGSHSELFG
jgi:mRNA interferase YafQ